MTHKGWRDIKQELKRPNGPEKQTACIPILYIEILGEVFEAEINTSANYGVLFR